METAYAVAPEIGLAGACRAPGVSRATACRRRSPRPPSSAPRARRGSPPALPGEERSAVLAELHAERLVDASPAAACATLLDEGTHLASERTMYRLLAASEEVRERREQLRHPAYARPELPATRPNELWSWDISRLKGPAKWTPCCLHVLPGVFSRHVPGWMVATRESAALAERLIADAVARRGVAAGALTPAIVHAGRAPEVRAARAPTLHAARAAHPERFVRRPPTPPRPPTAAWINRPARRESEPQ